MISDLQDHTYFAKLRVRQDGELIEIDCRPSDAIAVAVTAKVPIWVAEDVLAETAATRSRRAASRERRDVEHYWVGQRAARRANHLCRSTVPYPCPTVDWADPKNWRQPPKMNFFSVQAFPHPIGFGHPSGVQLCLSHQSCHGAAGRSTCSRGARRPPCPSTGAGATGPRTGPA